MFVVVFRVQHSMLDYFDPRKQSVLGMRFLQWLGYAGLIPFVALVLLSHWPIWPELQAETLFQRYSAIILAFMAGVLWPVWSQQAPLRPLAVFAVSIPVLSFLAGVLPDAWLIGIELLLFLLLRIGERWFGLDQLYHPEYLKLRQRLTRVVVLCHGLMLLLLLG